MMFVLHRRHRPPQSITRRALLFFNVDDVRTSQETRTSTVYYGDSLTFLYVRYEDVEEQLRHSDGEVSPGKEPEAPAV
jgi:hypothetical protein